MYLHFETPDRAARVQKLAKSGARVVVAEPRWPGFHEVAKKEKPFAIAIDFSHAPSHCLETADYLAKAKETRETPLYLLRVPYDRLDIVRKRLSAGDFYVTEAELSGKLAELERQALEKARQKKEAAAEARKIARAKNAKAAGLPAAGKPAPAAKASQEPASAAKPRRRRRKRPRRRRKKPAARKPAPRVPKKKKEIGARRMDDVFSRKASEVRPERAAPSSSGAREDRRDPDRLRRARPRSPTCSAARSTPCRCSSRSAPRRRSTRRPAIRSCTADSIAAADLPTVTVYNHLDVQPAEGDDWKTAPFDFVKKGDRYFARGTTDDKGPAITALFGARYAWENGVPANIHFLWEFEEEIGSPHFEVDDPEARRRPSRRTPSSSPTRSGSRARGRRSRRDCAACRDSVSSCRRDRPISTRERRAAPRAIRSPRCAS